MSENKKRSFFERLTGTVHLDEEEEVVDTRKLVSKGGKESKEDKNWMEEENDEAELTVDVYQTPSHIVIQTMVAGVKPEDLDLTIARDMITIKGKREEHRNIDEDNYFTKELYWGKFSRTILLPQEVEPEEVEAIEKHGLLTVKIQKVDKDKKNSIKVKSV
jgi:HSP20 family protein